MSLKDVIQRIDTRDMKDTRADEQMAGLAQEKVLAAIDRLLTAVADGTTSLAATQQDELIFLLSCLTFSNSRSVLLALAKNQPTLLASIVEQTATSANEREKNLHQRIRIVASLDLSAAIFDKERINAVQNLFSELAEEGQK